MIGIDTNILIRYFARDDTAQLQIATDLLEKRLTEQEPGFINAVVMTETVWVLRRTYSLSREDVYQIIQRLLQTENLQVEHEFEVFYAARMMRVGRGSFYDSFIGRLNTLSGCSTTCTFDKQASKLEGFSPVRSLTP